jgi:iron complex outermembrane receptor protein
MLSRGLVFAQAPAPAQPPPAPAPAQPAPTPEQAPAAPAPEQAPAAPADPAQPPAAAEPPPPAAPSPEQAPTKAAPEVTEDAAVPAEPDALGQVTVTAERDVPRIEAGPLGNRTIFETPFSVSQATSQQINRIAATTIDAALSYDASVRSNNSGVASGNTFSVRGQSVDLTNGYKFDGLAFPYWFQDQPVEGLSEIQVLKGTGGFVYGYASPSGVVNFVSKKPTKELEVRANLSLRSSSIWRAHVDVGGPLRKGDKTAFRLNAVHEEGTLYNGAENKNQFLTLWLQGEITRKLTWSIDGFYQRTWQARQSNGISLAPTVTHLEPVSGTLNLGSAATTKFNDVRQITGRLRYEFSPDWSASVALRTSSLDERFPGNTVQVTSNTGDYQQGLLNQNRLFFYYVGQATVDGVFKTGPLVHKVVAGFDYLDINFEYDHQPYTATGLPTTSFGFNLTGNLYRGEVPDWGGNPAAQAYQRPPDWFRYQEIRQRGLFVSDTVTYGPAELLVGARYTNYKETNNEPVRPDTSYSENTATPIAALSYDILDGVRAYTSYVEALQRGAQAPSNATNFGQSFGPLRSRQFEAGLKAQQRRWGGTLAAYHTTVPSDILAAPPPGEMLGTWARDGERRYQGIELSIHVSPQKQWLLNFSTAYLDATQTKATDPNLVGKNVPGTTAFQAAGNVQYSPSYVPGFRVFGGVRYSGKAYGLPMNTFVFSPVAVADVGLGYSIPAFAKSEIQLQGNISNVTGENYWIPTATGNGLSAGAPRVFSVSVGLAPRGPDADAPAAADEPADLKGGAVPPGRLPKHWYIGLDAGLALFSDQKYDVRALIDPSLGVAYDAVEVEHSPGWAIGGQLGYDFGIFRTELDITRTQANLNQVNLASTQVPIDSSGRPAGTYDDPGGTTRVLAFLFNGMFDVGGNAHTPWAVQAGGGIGLANVNSRHWALEDSVAPAFQVDNKNGLAWQVLAGVRRTLNERLDLTLKYRFFSVNDLDLFTTNANQLNGTVSSHSVTAGTTINF